MTKDNLIPIELTLIESAAGPVNKKISIGADGKLKKKSVAAIFSGAAYRIPLNDWRDMAFGITRLAANQAICLGRLREGLGALNPATGLLTAFLTTAGNTRELAKPGRFSRTQGNIAYTGGVPAPVAIDFDDAGMPDSVHQRIANTGGLIPALESICPELATAAYISRGSTSSGLTIDATGQRFQGGQHHFVILSDGADAQQFLDDLFDRAWLNGFGWIQIGTAGQLLKRSIIDKCVWDPARFVFEADATLGPGLSQDPRPATIHEGRPLVCPVPLTVAECLEVADLVSWAEKKAGPAGRRQRKVWGEAHIAKMVASGSSREGAEKTLREWAKGVLYPDAVLEFVKPVNVCLTVREILADPQKYDGWHCEHPIEGSEYKALGKFFADSMKIFTFGHGGQTFSLIRSTEGL
jgi:hypothetical protein